MTYPSEVDSWIGSFLHWFRQDCCSKLAVGACTLPRPARDHIWKLPHDACLATRPGSISPGPFGARAWTEDRLLANTIAGPRPKPG
jgi:hypothetical protein